MKFVQRRRRVAGDRKNFNDWRPWIPFSVFYNLLTEERRGVHLGLMTKHDTDNYKLRGTQWGGGFDESNIPH